MTIGSIFMVYHLAAFNRIIMVLFYLVIDGAHTPDNKIYNIIHHSFIRQTEIRQNGLEQGCVAVAVAA